MVEKLGIGNIKKIKMDNINNPNESAYLKSLIKIAHPDWNQEQIESEYQRKISEPEKEDGGGCEFCSA